MKRRELLVATGNAGKLRELRELLKDEPFTLIGLADLPHFNTVAETGVTFTENASIKASGYARQSKLLTLADDSGLEVDALDRVPGVWSARYLGEDTSYPDRMQALLSSVRDWAVPTEVRASFAPQQLRCRRDGAARFAGNLRGADCDGAARLGGLRIRPDICSAGIPSHFRGVTA